MLLNVYRLSVSGAPLGSPAQRSDITDGFFKYSLDGRTHSTKGETTYSECVGSLIVDESIWEIYESEMSIPVLFNRKTNEGYNTLTDVLIERRNDIWNLSIVSSGFIQNSAGLNICEPSDRAVNVWDFEAIADA